MGKSKFLQDFKEFAVKGNAVEMAVGVIIGGAFGKIVTSIVNDLIMPPIGWLINGINFRNFKYQLPMNPLNHLEEPVYINYGSFLQACFDFFIIAFCVFLMLRTLMRITNRKEEEEKQKPAVPSKEELLLKEIRDLLKQKSSQEHSDIK